MNGVKVFPRRRSADPTRPQISVFSCIILAILFCYMALLAGLLIWAIVISFREYGPEAGYFANVADSFKNFTIQTAKGSIGFGEMLRNSLLYALGCAFFNTLVVSFTAYAAARYRCWFSRLVYATVILTMIIPSVGSLPAEVSTAIRLHLYDSIWGQWVMKANFLGLYFLLFYDFFASLPRDYFEASEIDGANDFTQMFRLAFPLASNLILTVFLLNFVTYWNDYASPTIYLKSYPTLAVGLYSTFNYGLVYYKLNGAASVVPIAFAIASPVIAIYAVFHKKLMSNLFLGGIKE